jgi:hypothetical protein
MLEKKGFFDIIPKIFKKVKEAMEKKFLTL